MNGFRALMDSGLIGAELRRLLISHSVWGWRIHFQLPEWALGFQQSAQTVQPARAAVVRWLKPAGAPVAQLKK